MLKAFDIASRVLVVIEDDNQTVMRACANIANVTVINASLVNVYDIAANAKCIMTKQAVKLIEEQYNPNEEASA
ncbi:MAG: 50S ribosomal protein L4, partial [Clostridia bacterium]